MVFTNNLGGSRSFNVIVLVSILIINGDFGYSVPFSNSVESKELCLKFSSQNPSQKIVLIGIYDGTTLMIIDKHLSIFYFSLNDPNQAVFEGYQKFYPELLNNLQFQDIFLDSSSAKYKFQSNEAYISRCDDELAITFMKTGQTLIHHMSFRPIENIVEILDIPFADTIYNKQPDSLILLSDSPGVSKSNKYWIKQGKNDNKAYLVRAEYRPNDPNDLTCRYPVKNQSKFQSYPFCFKLDDNCVQAIKTPILKGFFGPSYIYVMDDQFIHYVKISEITRKESTFTMHTLLVKNFFKCNVSGVANIASYIENIPDDIFIVTIIMLFGIIIVCGLIVIHKKKQAKPQQSTSAMMPNDPNSPAYKRERMGNWIPGSTGSYRANLIRNKPVRPPMSRINISRRSYINSNYGRSPRRSVGSRRRIGRYRSKASSRHTYHRR